MDAPKGRLRSGSVQGEGKAVRLQASEQQIDVREGKLAFARHFSEDEIFGARPLKDVAVKLGISGPHEMESERGIDVRSLAAMYAAAVGETGIRFSKEDRPDFSIDLSMMFAKRS